MTKLLGLVKQNSFEIWIDERCNGKKHVEGVKRNLPRLVRIMY